MTTTLDAQHKMSSYIGRHADKYFDWGAFSFNDGFPELERAQMRYIGSGGSPRTDDPHTLKPEHFTLSMIYKNPGKYASSHAHEVEESFLVLGGVLSVFWVWGDEAICAKVGPKDLCLNARNRPHGFRNEGTEPVLASITVGAGRPLPPQFALHPRDGDPARAARFGAAEGKTYRLDAASNDPRHREFARHIVRYSEQPVVRGNGFSKKVYVGDGGAPAGTYRMDLIHLKPGQGVKLYERDVEDVFLVLEGTIKAGWHVDGQVVERGLGRHDLIFNPAGQPHYFRNDGLEDAQFMMLTGKADPEDVRFTAAD